MFGHIALYPKLTEVPVPLWLPKGNNELRISATKSLTLFSFAIQAPTSFDASQEAARTVSENLILRRRGFLAP